MVAASSSLFGAKTSCIRPQPKVGRFTRSPGDGEEHLLDRGRGCGRRDPSPRCGRARRSEMDNRVASRGDDAGLRDDDVRRRARRHADRLAAHAEHRHAAGDARAARPATHCAVTQGGLAATRRGCSRRPRTGWPCVTTGCPLTSTRGNGAVGCAVPACTHSTVAPRWTMGPGMFRR